MGDVIVLRPRICSAMSGKPRQLDYAQLGKGSYIGGSTIVGFGRQWSDSADFPNAATPSSARNKKKPPKKTTLPTIVPPLVIPIRQANLVTSILKDLGRSAPTKRNRLNNVLRRLIDDGVITSDGAINPQHSLIKEWLIRSDDKLGRKQAVGEEGAG